MPVTTKTETLNDFLAETYQDGVTFVTISVRHTDHLQDIIAVVQKKKNAVTLRWDAAV